MIATEAGSQLEELITFVNDLANQTISALRNGLTFRDNFNCIIQQADLKHDTASVINTNGKRPSGVMLLRVVSQQYGSDSLGWFINEQNQTIVTVKYSVPLTTPATPTPTDTQKCVFLILFD